MTSHVPIKTGFNFSQKNTCELLVCSPCKEKGKGQFTVCPLTKEDQKLLKCLSSLVTFLGGDFWFSKIVCPKNVENVGNQGFPFLTLHNLQNVQNW